MTKCAININGKITPPEKASISVFDRGFLFGDSIYEATLCLDGVPLFWQEHMQRLKRSAELIQLNLETNLTELKNEVQRTIKSLALKKGLLRLIITRGTDVLNIFPTPNTPNNFIIIYKELAPYPESWLNKGLHFTIANVKRNHPKTTNPEAKTGNYINNVMAAIDAQKKGVNDALMTNLDGLITEGTTNNFWVVKNDTIYTPPVESGLLSGITRANIIDICHQHKIPIRQANLTPDEVLKADEAFITSSTKGVLPVTLIDHKKIGSGTPGKHTLQLRKLYLEIEKDYVQKRL